MDNNNFEFEEFQFRKGYYYALDDVINFKTSGGLTRQLLQWAIDVFEWTYRTNCAQIIPPPKPPPPWNKTSKKILERDKNKCAYCMTDAAKTVDHIVPIRDFGTDDEFNLVCCCNVCNSKKGVKHPLEWNKSKTFLDKNPSILNKLKKKFKEYF